MVVIIKLFHYWYNLTYRYLSSFYTYSNGTFFLENYSRTETKYYFLDNFSFFYSLWGSQYNLCKSSIRLEIIYIVWQIFVVCHTSLVRFATNYKYIFSFMYFFRFSRRSLRNLYLRVKDGNVVCVYTIYIYIFFLLLLYHVKRTIHIFTVWNSYKKNRYSVVKKNNVYISHYVDLPKSLNNVILYVQSEQYFCFRVF